MSEAPNVIAKTYDLLKWLMLATSKFPKDKRYTLGQSIENKLLDIMDNFLDANYSKEKIEMLKNANLQLEQLRYLIRLSFDLRLIDLKRYEYVSNAVNEIGKMTGGWIKHGPGL